MKNKRILLPLLTALLLTVGFEIGLELANVSRFILPRPSLVLKALSENWPWIFANLKVTVQEAIVGCGLAGRNLDPPRPGLLRHPPGWCRRVWGGAIRSLRGARRGRGGRIGGFGSG